MCVCGRDLHAVCVPLLIKGLDYKTVAVSQFRGGATPLKAWPTKTAPPELGHSYSVTVSNV